MVVDRFATDCNCTAKPYRQGMLDVCRLPPGATTRGPGAADCDLPPLLPGSGSAFAISVAFCQADFGSAAGAVFGTGAGAFCAVANPAGGDCSADTCAISLGETHWMPALRETAPVERSQAASRSASC